MEAVVDLSPRASADPLAREIRRRVLMNVERERGASGYFRMWGTCVLTRRHREDALEGRSRELTLRFDFGNLVIHSGRVGRPDVSLWGSDEQILQLGELVPRWAEGMNFPWASVMRRATALRAGTWGAGRGPSRLEIFGRLTHPRLIYRLARILDSSA